MSETIEVLKKRIKNVKSVKMWMLIPLFISLFLFFKYSTLVWGLLSMMSLYFLGAMESAHRHEEILIEVKELCQELHDKEVDKGE